MGLADPAAAVAFQTLTRRAVAEGRLSPLPRDFAKHKLQATGEMTAATPGEPVSCANQSFEGVVRKNGLGQLRQTWHY